MDSCSEHFPHTALPHFRQSCYDTHIIQTLIYLYLSYNIIIVYSCCVSGREISKLFLENELPWIQFHMKIRILIVHIIII